MQLHNQNAQLREFSDNPYVQDIIDKNSETIDALLAELDKIVPPIEVVEVDPALEAEMNDAMLRLVESRLPLYEMRIDPSTGILQVKVDIERTKDIDKEVRRVVGEGIPLDIRYDVNDAIFNGSCASGGTGFCNPLIGGSFGQDASIELDCTISLAVKRNIGGGQTEDGIIIPDHCNPDTDDYYQYDTSNSAHLVGSETKDGGWFCDCDFIKSNSRTIDGTLVNVDGFDHEIDGKSDMSVNEWMFTYGQTTGLDAGRVKSLNVWKAFAGNWFTDLYEIEFRSLTIGDSGAPYVSSSSNDYGGMHIGEDSGYHYGHDWTFLVSKLDIQ